jgi:cytochrome P450
MGCAGYSEIQDKLRTEISEIPTNTPSHEEFTTLPYLDAIARETLRAYPPIPAIARVAGEDCVVHLSEPRIDVNGKKHGEILCMERSYTPLPGDILTCSRIRGVPKNAYIYVLLIHLSKDAQVWGADAHEFRPERWSEGKLPEAC